MIGNLCKMYLETNLGDIVVNAKNKARTDMVLKQFQFVNLLSWILSRLPKILSRKKCKFQQKFELLINLTFFYKTNE